MKSQNGSSAKNYGAIKNQEKLFRFRKPAPKKTYGKIGFLKKILPKKGRTTGYAYTNTRVRVMKSKLISPHVYQKLLKMQPDEIARYLEETEYKKEIDSLAAKYSGVNLIEYGLVKNLENTYCRILKFAIGVSKQQVRLYLRKWDVWNIKTILRGKYAGAPNEEILNNIVACGTMNADFWKIVIEKSKNVDDVIEMLKLNPFYADLKKNSINLGAMEDILDRFYYSYVLENAEPELRRYIIREIDAVNAQNSLRSEHLGDYNYWLEGGMEAIPIPKGLDKIEKRIYLRKYIVEESSKMVHEFKNNIRPILGYFIAKENEVRNIRILVRGMQAGLPSELIEKQLVY